MRRSRFSEEQIVGILKEHKAGRGVADLCRKYGISDATFYKWRSKYGRLEVSEAKPLRSLELENAKLKRLYCECDAGRIDTQGDAGKKLLTPRIRRGAVEWAMKERGHS